MNCPRCGAKIEKDWEYCPKCGVRFRKRDDFFSGFFDVGKIFDRFQKMQEEINKSFEKDFEVFDLSPAFRKPVKGKSSGFTIKITRVGNKEPKVSVNTFGDVDRESVKREVKDLAEDAGIDIRQPAAREHKPKEELPVPKYTEEPKTSVKRLDSKVLVEIDVPGVKSDDNIRVNELENSVEVKALAGDKAYFKILTKPEQFRITRKEFRKGKLLIEFS
jgi:HSP20 family molecular chaperone IbpA